MRWLDAWFDRITARYPHGMVPIRNRCKGCEYCVAQNWDGFVDSNFSSVRAAILKLGSAFGVTTEEVQRILEGGFLKVAQFQSGGLVKKGDLVGLVGGDLLPGTKNVNVQIHTPDPDEVRRAFSTFRWKDWFGREERRGYKPPPPLEEKRPDPPPSPPPCGTHPPCLSTTQRLLAAKIAARETKLGKGLCPFVFKSTACGATEGDIHDDDCGKTFGDCRDFGNVHRFGGFPSLERFGVVRLGEERREEAYQSDLERFRRGEVDFLGDAARREERKNVVGRVVRHNEDGSTSVELRTEDPWYGPRFKREGGGYDGAKT